jgi:hypothetical protein
MRHARVLTLFLVSSAARAQESEPSPLSLEERVKLLEARLAQLPAAAVVVPDAGAPAAAASPGSDFAPEKTPFPGDYSWAPANNGGSEHPFSFGPFTGEVRADVAYHHSFAEPIDNTISGSSEVFRHGEFQLTQFGFGGDFYYKGAHARLMTQFGMYSTTTPRNDPSAARGQWQLDDAYRYISEGYAGYHFNVQYGLNIQAGIFMSYVGLWSYYNFDNWTYQPSYVSSNTPWFFNGMRVQWFPTEHLKIEPWLVNGWQAYGRFNNAPGLGVQILWKPTEWFVILGNQYGGTDTLGTPDLKRVHTDDSVMLRYFNNPGGVVSRGAASLTLDAGCEWGVNGSTVANCGNRLFVGFMAYNRLWFFDNRVGFTVGGGAISNPGWYLVLVPPINGATAFSGSPYLDTTIPFRAWDMQITLDFSPVQYVMFRGEYNHRAANVPYFSGSGGVTPPGGNQGAPGSLVEGWSPDLRPTEDRLTFSIGVKI